MSENSSSGKIDEGRGEAIAITGIGCRFPGDANDPDSFWELMCSGRDAVSEIPDDRWSAKAFFHPDPAARGKSYTKWGGFLSDIRGFDAAAFGISPREAVSMDPQQRILLECAHEAIEDSGHSIEEFAGSRTGVFLGICYSDYAQLQTTSTNLLHMGQYASTGSVLSGSANKISYCFDLRGPSFAVDTACSSSLVALHAACRSLREGECETALAAGVNVLINPEFFIAFCRMRMLSPTGRCRAFDEGADGFVRGEGAGVVVLKPLSRAIADRDPVYAVLRGTGVNEDGRTNGITIPSGAAQEELLRTVYREAGIEPSEVDYVEAHGTGTAVGDPIEANAIGRVLCDSSRTQPLPIGSVKTNIGHLEGGAGIAGLIKASLVLKHGQIPPSLHFNNPNPDIDFETLGLTVPLENTPLERSAGRDLVVGINSFGFGGANGHAVLSSAPLPISAEGRNADSDDTETREILIPLSARTEEALRDRAGSIAEYLDDLPEEISLKDVSYTAGVRRTHFDFRLLAGGKTKGLIAKQLREYSETGHSAEFAVERRIAGPKAHVAFVFSGQGPQWWGMGRELLETDPVFRERIEACDKAIQSLGGWSLLEEMRCPEEESSIERPSVAQPAIFAVQVGLAAVLQSRGIEPEAVVGHSVGEIAAAHVAGILSFEDAVRVIFHRGRCMEGTPETGRMLAVGLSAAEVEERELTSIEGVELGAVNGPRSVTLSGNGEALAEVEKRLASDGVFCRFLKVNRAFHSREMEAAHDDFLVSLEGIVPQEAGIPFAASAGKAAFGKGTEKGPKYWWKNIRDAVRFYDSVSLLLEKGMTHFVELSPHPVLSYSIRECAVEFASTSGSPGEVAEIRAIPTLRRDESETVSIRKSLGMLYGTACALDWERMVEDPEKRKCVSLPAYPWQREVFWNESPAARNYRLEEPLHPLVGRRLDGGDPVWCQCVDTVLFPFLLDHAVRDRLVFPAVGYLEMALSVSREIHERETATLADIDIVKALFLQASGGSVHLLTEFSESGGGGFRIVSRALGNEGSWDLHARGVIRSSEPFDEREDKSSFDPDPIKARCGKVDGNEAVYEEYRQADLKYGPSFQSIHRRWLGKREALAFLEPDKEKEQDENYFFHPGTFDTCLQLMASTMPIEFHLSRSGVFVPVHIGQLNVFRKPLGRLWIHAVANRVTARTIEGDVRVYDEQGGLVLEMTNVRSMEAFRSVETADDWLYATQWKNLPLPDREEQVPRSKGESRLTDANMDSILAEAARVVSSEESLSVKSSGALDRIVESGEDTDNAVAALLRNDPAAVYEILLVHESIRAGGKPIGEVVSGDFLEAFYTDSPSMRPGNRLLVESVDGILATGEGTQQKWKVLELGKGWGGVTIDVINRDQGRNENRIECYHFLPTEDAGVEPALRRLRSRVSLEVLDGLPDEGETYDFLILSDPSKTGPFGDSDPAEVFRRVAPGGVILWLQLEEPSPWQRTLGLGDGGCGWDGEELGWPRSAGLPDSGFQIVGGEIDPASCAEEAEAEVVVEEEEAVEEIGNWLIVADDGGRAGEVADSVAAALASRGGNGVIVPPSDCCEATVEEWIEETASKATPSKATPSAEDTPRERRILFLAALDAASPSETTAATLEKDEASICHRALSLVQLLGNCEVDPPKIYFVTAGAQPVEEAEKVEISQTPMIGFGRVVQSEMPALGGRLIDLDPTDGSVDFLIDEVTSGSREEEVAFREGKRFVPRVQRQPLDGRNTLAGDLESDAADSSSKVARPFRLEVPESSLLEHVHFREQRSLTPGPNEVLIEVHSAGLNFRDVLKVLGLYPPDMDDFLLLGDECAGIVLETGKSVSGLKPGDSVVAATPGCLASHALAPAHLVQKLPQGVSFDEAATLSIPFLTALFALEEVGHLSEGESVLIQAAAGGVGLAALQVARKAGAEIFATASASKQELVKLLGAAHVMNSRETGFADRIRKITNGRGVDVVLNSLAGESLREGFSVLAPYGRFLELGKIDIFANHGLPMRGFTENVSFSAIDLSRVMSDRPELCRKLTDELIAGLGSGDFHPLPFRRIPASRVAEAFRQMSQGRHLGKVVIDMTDPAIPVRPPRAGEWRLREDGTYLVTGGFSGFGLEFARSALKHGARNLILIGRSGASTPRAKRALAEMREWGANVFEGKVDVSDCDALRKVIEEAIGGEEGMPPLRGVFHAAMVLDDCVIPQLTPERFERAMRPKVSGGWNLHQLTEGEDLDFFILCSSIAALVGNPGQANYAAANTFLDHLAHYRRSQGLPALSINWGVLGEFGVVSEDEKMKTYYETRGVTAIPPRSILEITLSALANDVVQMGAMRVNWERLATALFHFKDRIKCKLDEVVDRDALDRVSAGGSIRFREQLNALAREEALELVVDELSHRIASILGSRTGRLDVEAPLNSMGLDSLMVVELQTQLDNELGAWLPASEFARQPSIRSLSASLYDCLICDASPTG